jgi:hypothetical protein
VEPVDQVVEVHDIAQAIRASWETRRDTPFTQVSWDDGAQSLLVYRVPGNGAFDHDVLSRAAARVKVRLADASRSFPDIENIKREILQASDLGARVWFVGTNADGSVAVGADGDLLAAQQALDARYGRGTAIVEAGGPRVRL